MVVERDEVVTIMEIIGGKEDESPKETGTEQVLDVDALVVLSDKEESNEDSRQQERCPPPAIRTAAPVIPMKMDGLVLLAFWREEEEGWRARLITA